MKKHKAFGKEWKEITQEEYLDSTKTVLQISPEEGFERKFYREVKKRK